MSGRPTPPAPSVSEPADRLRILVVEGSPTCQTLAQRVLRREGHSVSVVEDGLAALNTVRDGAYDLVLMEVVLPALDGREVARRIRERERSLGGHLPIVAVTAMALDSDREQCLAAGMDGFVPKPYRPDELLLAIEIVLEELALSQSA